MMGENKTKAQIQKVINELTAIHKLQILLDQTKNYLTFVQQQLDKIVKEARI